MKLIIPPIYERIIDSADPFSVDVFGRGQFAKNLTRLFKNSEDSLVITINSNWGDGKTTFIKLWELELQNSTEFIPIYYDAFKNDFSGDAFLSIAVVIHEALKKHLTKHGADLKNEKQIEFLKEKSKELAKNLLKTGSGLAIGALTSGIINGSKITDSLGDAFKTLTFDTLDLNIDEKFEAHIKSQKAITDYQDMLTKILNLDNNENKKIVFFVDELDRCRPNFAVEVIEKIKHLFNIKNIYFVLAINRHQLEGTIASVYGVTPDDAAKYLQKFVHLETDLPATHDYDTSQNNSSISLFIERLIEQCEIDKEVLPPKEATKTISALATEVFLELNPRSIERIITYLATSLSSCDKDLAKRFAIHLIPMAVFKVGNQELYEKYKSGNIQDDFHNENKKYFNWLKEYYAGKREDTASNVFKVPDLKEACKILDIYKIPSEINAEQI